MADVKLQVKVIIFSVYLEVLCLDEKFRCERTIYVPESGSRSQNIVAKNRNVCSRAILEDKFGSEKTKSVAESTSRDQIQQRESEKCRREHFSRPNSAASERKVSQRAVLEAQFSSE